MSHGLERLFSPSIYDIVFPFIAMLLVIVLPASFAVFAMVKVLRGDYSGEDQRK